MDDEILENPVTGESMRIVESTTQAFKAQYALRPHGEIPGEHFHPHEEQVITILSGEMHLRINGEHRILRAGQSAMVPPGARHFQWNPCDAEAVVIEELRPAGRIHDFFKILFRLAQDGRTDVKGYPSLLWSAALFSEFIDTIRPASLGLRLLIAVLAPVASMLGYRRAIEGYLHRAPGR
jgi:quercetin dioxygenase-like cupin family protein